MDEWTQPARTIADEVQRKFSTFEERLAGMTGELERVSDILARMSDQIAFLEDGIAAVNNANKELSELVR